MCFSPEMDLTAAVVIGVIAVDTLRRVRRPADLLLASLPAVFAVHQLVETFVWWGLDGTVPRAVGDAATHLYLVIAWLLPLLVPSAVLVAEPRDRRRGGAGFVLLGALVTTVLVGSLLDGDVSAQVEGHHLGYTTDVPFAGAVVVLYVVATCAPPLMSSSRHLRLYGLANVPVVAALGWLSQSGLVSLWCVWAALTSVAIDVHLRSSEARRLVETPVTEAT
ncbi:DUF6629 family protein [Nocardioides psychrotolerans]|uniref:DUF6629 family protein n=1 Tax=Nocardioides psychrotolerans TaxID=1005945 RepID=UPI003137D2F5